MVQKRLLAHKLHRVALPVQLLVVILLVSLKERGGPLADRLRTSKRCHHPELRNVSSGRTQSGEPIWIGIEIELSAVPPVEQGEVARANINLGYRLPIERHLEPGLLAHLLIIGCWWLTVEPPTVVPVEASLIAVMEDADVTLMNAPFDLLPLKELVQLPHVGFQLH